MPHYRMVLSPVVRLNLEKPRSALALINLKFFGSVLLDLRPNVEIKEPFLKGVKLFSKNVLLREGTQLGVAKAARFPPCTLPFLGRRFFSQNKREFGLQAHFISLGIPSQYERGMGQSFHFVSSFALRVTAFGRNP
ncbi:MAG: hypothetical protein IKM81_04445 [Fibrobacter sp.]|nr:hypothetical protein [Fibrobacter sp.]